MADATTDPTRAEFERQVTVTVERLLGEFQGRVTADVIVDVANTAVAELVSDAHVTNFVPLLAYRDARAHLNALARDRA